MIGIKLNGGDRNRDRPVHMNDLSKYDDLDEDDEAAWSCHSCPIKYLSVLAIGVAFAVLVAKII
ncbi:hypothetical protein CU103_20430 [Phyllobacterium sophorae]|uniref:Uncharacterized protein n=1 Tax=Phyllobacterium sophorae TaxID=1520277 RepID=A0A2P7B6W4_9HYPH|nr:hypothetical protein CU103_20430 [Phyllobacterium sophorae]